MLDTHLYEVEFPEGEITEVIDDITVELMYVQCDSNGEEYLLLESSIYYEKNDSSQCR